MPDPQPTLVLVHGAFAESASWNGVLERLGAGYDSVAVANPLRSVAGDAALIHGARTLLIAGGMVPRFIPFLRSSAFREKFLAKGRFVAYLEGVTIHVVTHPQPGLLGAAMSLRASAKESA